MVNSKVLNNHFHKLKMYFEIQNLNCVKYFENLTKITKQLNDTYHHNFWTNEMKSICENQFEMNFDRYFFSFFPYFIAHLSFISFFEFVHVKIDQWNVQTKTAERASERTNERYSFIICIIRYVCLRLNVYQIETVCRQ